MRTTYRRFLILLLVLFCVSDCTVQESIISGRKRAYAYTWEQELEMGRNADQEIVQQFGLLDDPDITEYVSKVGNKVLQTSDMRREDIDSKYRNTEFTFRVLDSPVLNAFALPGGYIYVTRGMLAHLSNEAQLAVVLGHEIGHVAARHASQRALNQTIGQIAVLGGTIIGQEVFGMSGQNIYNLSSTAAQLLFLSYSRDDEREADQLGVEYAAKQSYQASEGAALFTSLERLEEKSEDSIPNFLSTHPDPGEREKTIPKLAEEWENEGYNLEIINIDTYMNQIDGLVYGENPREGFVEDEVFYHPELAFQFKIPTRWRLINARDRVAMVNPDQNAVSILQIDADAELPRDAVTKIIRQEGITVLEEQSISDHPVGAAHMAVVSAVTQDGTSIEAIIYALEYDGQIYTFQHTTLEEIYDRVQDTFMGISNSFAEVTDSEILNIQPVRIRVYRANRSGKFHALLPSDIPMAITPEEVAVLNQVYLDDAVEQGSWIKMPMQ